jgi:hypothetical protein
MQFSRSHLAIALGSSGLLVLVFLGYLYWLSSQGPVLARSNERDTLTQMPVSITMNPFHDRTHREQFYRGDARRKLPPTTRRVGKGLPQEASRLSM